MKSIIINQYQAKALKQGATMLLIPIEGKMSELGLAKDLINHSPLQAGDNFYCKEQFAYAMMNKNSLVFWDIKPDYMELEPASKMTEQQSRFKFRAGEVSVKIVQDITVKECEQITKINTNIIGDNFLKDDFIARSFIDWLKDQGIDYNDNQYVALIKIGEQQ